MSTADRPAPPQPQPKAPYQPPRLERFGRASDLTKSRMMAGAMDGGSNNTRTG